MCLMDGVGGLFVQLYHKKDDRDIGGIILCIFGCDDLQFMDTQGISFLTGDDHVFYCNMLGAGNEKSKEMETEK